MSAQAKLRWCFAAFAAGWALLACAILSHVSHLMDMPWAWILVPALAALATNGAARIFPYCANGDRYWGAAAATCILFPGLMALVLPIPILLETAWSLREHVFTWSDVLSLPLAAFAIGYLAYGIAFCVAVPAVLSGLLVFSSFLWLMKLAGFCSRDKAA